MNKQCERKDVGKVSLSKCNYCIETGSSCDASLACLNISRPHYALQDFQMSLNLLEQQKRKRRSIALQEQDSMGHSASQPFHHVATTSFNFPPGNQALQNYQMQMMLLEQQNKKRLLMARQEQDTIDQSSSQPSQQSLLWSRHVPDDRVQNASPGPSMPFLDNQAPLQTQTCEEQPMAARSGQNACRRDIQPQGIMPDDPFASLPAPTIEAAGHPDHVSQPAAPSRVTSSVLPAPQ